MKLRNVLAALVLSLFASVAMADNCFNRPCEKADLPTCGAKLKGREFMVKNCVSASSCATTANPGFSVAQVCDYTGSAWAYRNSSGSGDVLLAGDADGQEIKGRSTATSPRIQLGTVSELDGKIIIGSDSGPYSSYFFTLDNGDENPQFTLEALKASYHSSLDCSSSYCAILSTNGATSTNFVVNYAEATLYSDRIVVDSSTVGGALILSTSTCPSSASDACEVGETCINDSFIYRCTATDTWKRVAIATW